MSRTNTTQPTRKPLGLLLRLPFFFDRLYWDEKLPYARQDSRLQAKITKELQKSNNRVLKQQGCFRTYLGLFYQFNQLVERLQVKASVAATLDLMIHSLEDTTAHPKNASLLSSWLGAQNKHLHYISGYDHDMIIDWKKDEVIVRVDAFITRCLRESTISCA